MLSRSLSRTEAAPTPIARARARIFAASRARASAESCLESSTPRMTRSSGGMITAHATTGPASGPRPTSSMPAMRGPTDRRKSRSVVLQRSRRGEGASVRSRASCPSARDTAALRLLRDRRARLGHRDTHLLLLDASCLAGEMTEVVELRAPHAPATHDRNLGEHRAVHRENALDADAVGDLPHGERLAHAAAATRNADAFERLNALLLTFFHTDVDAQCVTGAEGRNGAEPLFLSFDEGMHMTLGAGRSPRLAAATHRIKSFGKTAKGNGDHGRTLASVRACAT